MTPFNVAPDVTWTLADLNNWNETDPQNVTILDLACEELKEIPPKTFLLKNLKKLCIHNNEITELPLQLFDLKNLETLSLETNYIKEIPNEIRRLKKLKKVYLNFNPIRRVPKTMAKMKNVECHIYYCNHEEEKTPYRVRIVNSNEHPQNSISQYHRQRNIIFNTDSPTSNSVNRNRQNVFLIDTSNMSDLSSIGGLSYAN